MKTTSRLSCYQIIAVILLFNPGAWAKEPSAPQPNQAEIEQRERKQQDQIKSLSPEVQKVYQDMFQQAREQNVDLYKKLDEYREGKRGERDAYVILKKIHWNYQVLREASSAEAQKVAAELEQLKKKHPRFENDPSDKLSEQLTVEKKKKGDREKIRQEAARWTPQDATPMRTYDGAGFKIVAYQYRLEFFSGAGATPAKIVRFKYPIQVYPDPSTWGTDSKTNLLVCTNRFQEYSAMTDHEKKMLLHRGRVHSIPWVNASAERAAFCGVLDPQGNVVYEFPPEQVPGRIYYPLGIAGAGKRAAVLVGEKVSFDYEGERGEGPGRYREAWIWQHPSTLRKIKVTESEVKGTALHQRLRDGTL